MPEIERRIAVSVMTMEAMMLCLEENVSLFCVENPLYSEIHEKLPVELFGNYQIEIFEEKEVILLTKVKGENAFDYRRYILWYLPLFWENWHS